MVNPFIETRLPISQMEALTVGTLNYNRYTWLGHTDFYWVQGYQSMVLTETVDFAKFLQHSIAKGLISPIDIVDQVIWAARLDFLSCSINISLPLDDGGRFALHQNGSILTAAGHTFQRHSFLNSTSSEYFNVSYVEPPMSSSDIVLDYLLNSTPAVLRVPTSSFKEYSPRRWGGSTVPGKRRQQQTGCLLPSLQPTFPSSPNSTTPKVVPS